MFALWYDGANKKVEAVNGSGRCASNLSLDFVKEFYSKKAKDNNLTISQIESMHQTGIHSVTVPGAAQGWEDVHAKYGSGRLTFLQVLEPADELWFVRSASPLECGPSLRPLNRMIVMKSAVVLPI